MEDPKAPPVHGSNDSLFSERVALWLDAGDRLETPPAQVEEPGEEQPTDPGRLRRLLSRHRVGVMAGMGLLPLVLFVSLHRGSVAPASPPVAITAAPAPVMPPPVPPPAVAPAPAPAVAAPPAAPVAVAESPAAQPEGADEPTARQGRRHHHRRHHRTAHHRSTFHR
jgi:hypothetical protein